MDLSGRDFRLKAKDTITFHNHDSSIGIQNVPMSGHYLNCLR